MREKSLLVNGLKISYWEAGQGTPLFFIHGWGAQPKVYAETFSELAKKFRVIAPALLGHGRSASIPPHFQFAEYAEILVQFIEHFKSKKILLIGHSLGGALTSYISHKKPELVRQLFLIDPIGLKIERSSAQWKKLWLKKVRRNLRYRLGYQQFFGFINTAAKRRKDIKKATHLTTNLDLENMLQYIKVPTILLFGEKDVFFPAEYAYRYAEKIPNSQLEIIKNQGHDWCLLKPKLFKEVIEKYAETD